MHYIVINKNKGNIFLPYSKQYQVFEDRELAIAAWIEAGGDDPWGMGISNEVNRASIYMCGDVDVTFMPIEIQKVNS